MSLLNYIFDSEWSQRRDIESLRDADDRRSSRLQHVGNTVQGMERQIAEQALVIRALLARLRTQDGWDEEAFRQEVRELDMRDGRLDRKGPSAPLDA